MTIDTCSRLRDDAAYACLLAQYHQLWTLLDDRVLVQAAARLLDKLHVALNSQHLPPERVMDYWQLLLLTHACLRQRRALPSRPLF